MFARIVPVRDDKVVINGTEMTLGEALKLSIVQGIGVDDEGNKYIILKE